jgi:hypothetical protein
MSCSGIHCVFPGPRRAFRGPECRIIGIVPRPHSAEALLSVVASCSIHPVSEQHSQAVQSTLICLEMGSTVRPCGAGSGKRTKQEAACIRQSHWASHCNAPPPASRCQHRGGRTTRMSAPYIDSSIGALSSAPPVPLALPLGLPLGLAIGGLPDSREHCISYACEWLCSLPGCCCCCRRCPTDSVRLGGSRHDPYNSSITADFCGFAAPCPACTLLSRLLQCCCLGLLLPHFEQQKDRSNGVLLSAASASCASLGSTLAAAATTPTSSSGPW